MSRVEDLERRFRAMSIERDSRGASFSPRATAAAGSSPPPSDWRPRSSTSPPPPPSSGLSQRYTDPVASTTRHLPTTTTTPSSSSQWRPSAEADGGWRSSVASTRNTNGLFGANTQSPPVSTTAWLGASSDLRRNGTTQPTPAAEQRESEPWAFPSSVPEAQTSKLSRSGRKSRHSRDRRRRHRPTPSSSSSSSSSSTSSSSASSYSSESDSSGYSSSSDSSADDDSYSVSEDLSETSSERRRRITRYDPPSPPPTGDPRRRDRGSRGAGRPEEDGDGDEEVGDAASGRSGGRRVRWAGETDAGGRGGAGGGTGRVALSVIPTRRSTAANAMLSKNAQSSAFLPIQPSRLLCALVENVAYYRQVPTPRLLYPEVILAFDEYVARGSTMLKFIHHGPPHERFFAIRFLDLNHRRRRNGGERSVPEAVFCWFKSAESRTMRRFFPLSNLVSVTAGGAGHPFVERRQVKPGVLSNGRKGLNRKYMKDEYILQLRFVSTVSAGEEVLALKAPNPTVYLAWQVVGDYFSRIGQA